MTEENVNALCVVAHPDDETIWMGGTILENKGWSWTILSLCRKEDPDRAPKFKKVCEIYGAKGIISDLDDESDNPIPVMEVVAKIKENLPEEAEYDYIFTHGENGEYGHLRHVELYKAVTWMIKNKVLKCKKFFHFSYVDGGERAPHNPNLPIPVADRKAEWFVEMDTETYKKKFEIVSKIYGFIHPIFETLASRREEAFVLEK